MKLVFLFELYIYLYEYLYISLFIKFIMYLCLYYYNNIKITFLKR